MNYLSDSLGALANAAEKVKNNETLRQTFNDAGSKVAKVGQYSLTVATDVASKTYKAAISPRGTVSGEIVPDADEEELKENTNSEGIYENFNQRFNVFFKNTKEDIVKK